MQPKKTIVQPRKRFGQNFLTDPLVIQNIIHLIAPKPKDAIVEIGPGLGALTTPLLETIEHIDVIELDRDLAKILLEQTAQSGHSQNITVHQQDALKFDFTSLFHGQKLRIIGNLPYNISTPLLFHLLPFSSSIEDMHFMLQQEVVDRICAKPNTKAYGRLTIMVQCQCNVQSLFTVEPTAFKPAPKVMSKIVRLTPFSKPLYHVHDLLLLQQITTEAFNQRRKMVQNALKAYLTQVDFDMLSLNPQLRPEALSVQDFVKISNYISNKT